MLKSASQIIHINEEKSTHTHTLQLTSSEISLFVLHVPHLCDIVHLKIRHKQFKKTSCIHFFFAFPIILRWKADTMYVDYRKLLVFFVSLCTDKIMAFNAIESTDMKTGSSTPDTRLVLKKIQACIEHIRIDESKRKKKTEQWK